MTLSDEFKYKEESDDIFRKRRHRNVQNRRKEVDLGRNMYKLLHSLLILVKAEFIHIVEIKI